MGEGCKDNCETRIIQNIYSLLLIIRDNGVEEGVRIIEKYPYSETYILLSHEEKIRL
jgi:hypothetical protein